LRECRNEGTIIVRHPAWGELEVCSDCVLLFNDWVDRRAEMAVTESRKVTMHVREKTLSLEKSGEKGKEAKEFLEIVIRGPGNGPQTDPGEIMASIRLHSEYFDELTECFRVIGWDLKRRLTQ
jgi:hypothetical protein